MKATLKTENGRQFLEVEYDGGLLNWDEAIRAGLLAHGLRPGQIPVIARPTPAIRRGDQEQGQAQLFDEVEG